MRRGGRINRGAHRAALHAAARPRPVDSTNRGAHRTPPPPSLAQAAALIREKARPAGKGPRGPGGGPRAAVPADLVAGDAGRRTGCARARFRGRREFRRCPWRAPDGARSAGWRGSMRMQGGRNALLARRWRMRAQSGRVRDAARLRSATLPDFRPGRLPLAAHAARLAGWHATPSAPPIALARGLERAGSAGRRTRRIRCGAGMMCQGCGISRAGALAAVAAARRTGHSGHRPAKLHVFGTPVVGCRGRSSLRPDLTVYNGRRRPQFRVYGLAR